MQSYRDINDSDYISDAPALLNNNFKSIASDFMGASFPTSGLTEGMKCFRTDNSTLYRLSADLKTWNPLFKVIDGGIQVKLADKATNADHATNADKSTNADHATNADNADKAKTSDTTNALNSTMYATQSEAEAGTANNKVMTPLRTKQTAEKFCLPRSGGELKGGIVLVPPLKVPITNSVDNDFIQINGATSHDNGAYMILAGKDASSKGAFQLSANDGINKVNLYCTPDGSAKWANKEIERIDSQGSNYIRYSNGLQVCWGNTSSISVTANNISKQLITFPMPFKDVLTYGLNLSFASSTTGYADMADIQVGYTSRTTTNFELALWAGAISASRSPAVAWSAFGYWK